MVIFPERLHVSRSLSKTLRKKSYRITMDHAFRAVMEACAAPREGSGGTWIVPEMVEAYCRLHELGYAHSIEVWMEGELVGGLYGVGVGCMFFGESMFSRRRDASKIALVHLVRHLAACGMEMMDCQMHTDHLASMGGELVPRERFIATLKKASKKLQPPSMWEYGYSNEPA
jgi:leucyl/phenylalanyl-tRNA--protein transferase